jgi:hypothetical protein
VVYLKGQTRPEKGIKRNLNIVQAWNIKKINKFCAAPSTCDCVRVKRKLANYLHTFN